MNDRTKAIDILKQARDALQQRLTDQVLNMQEEIIDDANGESFMSEIDTINDQIGARLQQVNSMLSSLPPIAEPVPAESPYSDSQSSDVDNVSTDENISMVAETPALPAPQGKNRPALPAPEPASFQTFAMQIMADNVTGAGYTLAELLALPAARARNCAQVFRDNLKNDPHFMAKAQGMRQQLATGSINGSLMLLFECFGLVGPESIGAFQALQAHLAKQS